MNNTINDLELKVISLYQNGLLQREISKELRIDVKKVRRILKDNNVPVFTRTIDCSWCGNEFTTKYRHQNNCSEKCRSKFNKKNRGGKQNCIGCLKVFYKYKTTEYCSIECKRITQDKLKNKKELLSRLIRAIDPSRHKKCRTCNSTFYAPNLKKQYCSDSCRPQHINSPKEFTRRCKECGRHFITNLSKRINCSDVCRKRYSNRMDEIRRRSRLRENGKIDWSISLDRLIIRDKSICHICSCTVDKNDYEITKEGHFIAGENYPSIDHVVPVSKGGTHTWGNIKLAHRKCNWEKGNDENVQSKETFEAI